MKLNYEDKKGNRLKAPQIAAFLMAVKAYRNIGLRKSFAIACAAKDKDVNISQAIAHAIWLKRDKWLKI